MAPIVTAFDHQKHRKITAQHLADLHTFSDEVLTTFQESAYVASLIGRPWWSTRHRDQQRVQDFYCSPMNILPKLSSKLHSIWAKCMENLRDQIYSQECCTCTQICPPPFCLKNCIQRYISLVSRYYLPDTYNQQLLTKTYVILLQKSTYWATRWSTAVS